MTAMSHSMCIKREYTCVVYLFCTHVHCKLFVGAVSYGVKLAGVEASTIALGHLPLHSLGITSRSSSHHGLIELGQPQLHYIIWAEVLTTDRIGRAEWDTGSAVPTNQVFMITSIHSHRAPTQALRSMYRMVAEPSQLPNAALTFTTKPAAHIVIATVSNNM